MEYYSENPPRLKEARRVKFSVPERTELHLLGGGGIMRLRPHSVWAIWMNNPWGRKDRYFLPKGEWVGEFAPHDDPFFEGGVGEEFPPLDYEDLMVLAEAGVVQIHSDEPLLEE